MGSIWVPSRLKAGLSVVAAPQPVPDPRDLLQQFDRQLTLQAEIHLPGKQQIIELCHQVQAIVVCQRCAPQAKVKI